MNARRIATFHHLPALATSLAALAGSARAQCDYFVWRVPDFDQRRVGSATQIGLPGDGSMYCAPVSISNWFGYFANNGSPAFGGPQYRNWQSNVNYDLATNYISGMGALMGTDPVNGTSGTGEFNGLQAYVAFWAPGLFSVSYAWADPNTVIGPGAFWTENSFGGYSQACYGRYNDDGGGFFTRTGGHCITITGVKNSCGAGNPTLYFRDPADDGPNNTQSPFRTSAVQLVGGALNFRGDAGGSYEVRYQYRLIGYSPFCFLDGMIAIQPSFYIANTAPTLARVWRPFVPLGSGIHQLQIITLPAGGGTMLDVAVPPLMDSLYCIGGGSAAPSRVYRYDAASSALVPVLTSTNLKRICFGRFGEMYALDGASLSMYRVTSLPATLSGGTTPPMPLESIDYDDMTDELVGLSAAGIGPRHMLRYSRSLGTMTTNLPLPISTNIGGVSSLSTSPVDGSTWIAGNVTDMIYKITGGGSAPLVQAIAIALPPGSHPTGLRVHENGHIIFSSNGLLKEMEQGLLGWIDTPNSLYAGQPGGSSVALSRGRTNDIPSLHTGPGFMNLPSPQLAPSFPDCDANCDLSTAPPILNVNDFACFLNKFAVGDSYANCDNSTTPPILNVNDFACFLNNFAAGCP